jgi:hypothetical protein
VLTAALVLAAVLAGTLGTWSPCGFSMIETICAQGRRSVFCCAAFTGGAVAGGVATFGLVSLAGAAARGVVGGGIVGAAAAIAVGAALAEARAAAIRPQIRRQVPEHWRRVLPISVASALYGVLLGLGFTTFVLTFAVWAVAVVTLALGRPQLGLLVGIAFGLGRALPVVAIAPLAQHRLGIRVLDAIAQRPALLRAGRLAEAGALVFTAAALLTSNAGAATSLGVGTDPSAAGDLLAWTTPSGGVLRHEAESGTTAVPSHPVVGGSLVAWRQAAAVHVAEAADLAPLFDVAVPGVDALAVSEQWLVTRSRTPAGDTLTARPIAAPDQVVPIARVGRPSQLGRPALDGDILVYHLATRQGSRIVARDLVAGTVQVVRRSRAALLTNPATLDGQLLYVRQTNLAQLLELGPLGSIGRDRAIYSLAAPAPHDRGHERHASPVTLAPHPRAARWTLWTTALSVTNAYVALLPRAGSPSGARILAILR